MRKSLAIFLPALVFALSSWAQAAPSTLPLSAGAESAADVKLPDAPGCRRWEVAATAGTTGLGVEGAWRPAPQWRLRAGAEAVIPFNVDVNFNVSSYGGDGPSTGHNFDKMAQVMKELTGIEVDNRVTMDCKPRMFNGKLIADFFPWADKGWRVSAGFYVGSRKVVNARNSMGEMPALLAINIYNQLHDRILDTDFLETPIYQNGDEVVWLDPEVADQLQAKMRSLGNMGIKVGEFKDGTPYIMHPDKDGMVKGSAFVNTFKPYLGVGYDGTMRANRHVTMGFDLGMLFWGGTPSVIMHDGVNLSTEMKKIYGDPGRRVDFIKTFKVFPVATLRVAYSF